MPLEPQTNQEGVDLSDFYERPENKAAAPAMIPPAQSKLAKHTRLWILISIALVLVIAQGIIILKSDKINNTIPAGYHIVKHGNNPPVVEKIK